VTVCSFEIHFKTLNGKMRRNKTLLQVVLECMLSCFGDTVLKI
jgi:hypothetical protein